MGSGGNENGPLRGLDASVEGHDPTTPQRCPEGLM
jgi:hypothetical protein